MALLILVAAYGFTQVFSGRGALIHVGSFIGTIMAANVFMVIIPNQRNPRRRCCAEKPLIRSFGATGKQRSLHNTYLTLPVLLMMISNHYPMITDQPACLDTGWSDCCGRCGAAPFSCAH